MRLCEDSIAFGGHLGDLAILGKHARAENDKTALLSKMTLIQQVLAQLNQNFLLTQNVKFFYGLTYKSAKYFEV